MSFGNLPAAGPFTLTLVLVRHGETEWNAANRFQGAQDVPLSNTGRAQAQALRDRFTRTTRDGEPPLWCLTALPTTIWASDLSRAAETAEIIRPAFPELGVIQTLPLLRERSYGEWEGLTVPEIREKFGMASQPADAEPYETVLERNRQARNHIWNAVVSESSSGVALVVGHGGALRMMIALALGMGADAWHRIRMDNTGVSAVSFHGDTADTSTGRVLCVNDTTHFDALHDRDPRFRNDRPRITGPVG